MPRSSSKVELPSEVFEAMTEEEKIEWAKNHTMTTKRRTSLRSAAQLKAPRLKHLHTDSKKQRRRYIKNKDAVWTETQKEKARLLYRHNLEMKERRLYNKAIREYKARFKQDDKWLEKYRRTYKPNLDKYAETYVVKDGYEEYQLGFSLGALIKLMPIGKAIVNRLVEKDVIPLPLRQGYRLDNKTVSTTETLYYTLEEAKIILDIWQSYWRKARAIDSSDKELWLKKNFWKKVTEHRYE